MYKYSKDLEYPLNLLEDAMGFLGDSYEWCGSANFGKKERKREKNIEEILKDVYGIEANETFFKWLDKYIEKEFNDDVRLMFDKRYKEKKSKRKYKIKEF